MIRIALFILCTIFFIRFSRRALASPGSHGFYRFFVFEGLLLLVLLNHPYWFREPFSPLHLVSWFCLGVSIYFVIHSFVLLKQRGGHAGREEMPENHSFENTVRVVEEGLYRYIRHPMYASLLFLGWGAFFKHITLLNIGLIILVSAFLVAVAKVEERENINFFGLEYADYMQRTKMFIPWLL
ncbi:MAG: isoprenylcysteine carboxylmethyltransferase family protein [Deltaproteobacteria bacterium]|nr:isoprenylcysteine carboxylmethyltransferase family protein [Candidatus Tharpella aukensis]